MSSPPDPPISLAAMYADDWRADAETIKDVVSRLALQHGEKPEPLLKQIENRTPAGRFLVKILGLDKPTVQRGRPIDDEQVKRINDAVDDLIDGGLSEAQAIKAAPSRLYRQGICGNGHPKRPLSQRAIKDARAKQARRWFEPPSPTASLKF